ncbi:FdhF/YdeP family oxidoreductase [Vibrio hibernica]|uniref:FdhF/YdeP family oxidoreductase n=1 Tax=Vibrio hibernica TaxID=2587465 RepID=UPI001880D1B1|nr:FdhF/YdeP family oxidoreductase [Vibrio hibernica]
MAIKKYTHAAGGWGALVSTGKHLLKSENVAQNIRNLMRTNQDKGFDCPGCAWGEDGEKGLFHFCENGAKAVNWEGTSRRVDGTFFAAHSVKWLRKQSDYYLEYQGRLNQPVRYNADTDHYEAISWDDAFALIAKHLKQLESPNQAEFYTSGRASNEAAFLYQLFARSVGTNNFPDCSNMCHEATSVALVQAIGIGKGTTRMDDFAKSDAIFLFGQNPATNHPRMMDTLYKASRRGASIVSFNNLKERGLERFTNPQNKVEMITNGSTPISGHYFTPKLGGDMAAVRGMVKALYAFDKNERSQGRDSIFDHAYIEKHTNGMQAYLDQVDATSWAEIIEQSGLTQQQLETAAETYRKAERVIITWAMGITQHKHSVNTIQEMVNLQLLFGQIGKEGAGVCPIRGHSNVQGDRTVGINERPSASFLAKLEAAAGFKAPTKPGHNVVESIKSMLAGESKVFIGLGGNFVSATPDTRLTQQALESCNLTVNIATKLNRTHLSPGKDSLVLPCLGRTDVDWQKNGQQCVTVEDSFSMVHASYGAVEHDEQSNDQGAMRSEPAIIAGMAQATLGSSPIDWLSLIEDYDRIRSLIEKVIPGFEGVNDKIKQPGGFYLGNSARDNNWQTKSGKAEFNAHSLPTHLQPAALRKMSDKAVFVLQTMRSHDQYNTTVYGFDDRYRGVFGERKVLFMNKKDIQNMGMKAGDRVDIQSLYADEYQREIYGFKLVEYEIPEGNIAAYFPEANPLVALHDSGDLSDTPVSKAIVVTLKLSEKTSENINLISY